MHTTETLPLDRTIPTSRPSARWRVRFIVTIRGPSPDVTSKPLCFKLLPDTEFHLRTSATNEKGRERIKHEMTRSRLTGAPSAPSLCAPTTFERRSQWPYIAVRRQRVHRRGIAVLDPRWELGGGRIPKKGFDPTEYFDVVRELQGEVQPPPTRVFPHYYGCWILRHGTGVPTVPLSGLPRGVNRRVQRGPCQPNADSDRFGLSKPRTNNGICRWKLLWLATFRSPRGGACLVKKHCGPIRHAIPATLNDRVHLTKGPLRRARYDPLVRSSRVATAHVLWFFSRATI
jgi:hypothetical protein